MFLLANTTVFYSKYVWPWIMTVVTLIQQQSNLGLVWIMWVMWPLWCVALSASVVTTAHKHWTFLVQILQLPLLFLLHAFSSSYSRNLKKQISLHIHNSIPKSKSGAKCLVVSNSDLALATWSLHTSYGRISGSSLQTAFSSSFSTNTLGTQKSVFWSGKLCMVMAIVFVDHWNCLQIRNYLCLFWVEIRNYPIL